MVLFFLVPKGKNKFVRGKNKFVIRDVVIVIGQLKFANIDLRTVVLRCRWSEKKRFVFRPATSDLVRHIWNSNFQSPLFCLNYLRCSHHYWATKICEYWLENRRFALALKREKTNCFCACYIGFGEANIFKVFWTFTLTFSNVEKTRNVLKFCKKTRKVLKDSRKTRKVLKDSRKTRKVLKECPQR